MLSPIHFGIVQQPLRDSCNSSSQEQLTGSCGWSRSSQQQGHSTSKGHGIKTQCPESAAHAAIFREAGASGGSEGQKTCRKRGEKGREAGRKKEGKCGKAQRATGMACRKDAPSFPGTQHHQQLRTTDFNKADEWTSVNKNHPSYVQFHSLMCL